MRPGSNSISSRISLRGFSEVGEDLHHLYLEVERLVCVAAIEFAVQGIELD
jgi:hypothetical protein